MAIGKIEQVKKGKLFRIWDLIAYGAIALIIAALFLSIFLTTTKTVSEGFKISYKGAKVFEYSYTTSSYEVLSESNIKVLSESEEELLLLFNTEGGKGYNKIKVDKKGKAVSVTEADCSIHRDCVYTPALKDASSIISCPPHSMLIEPLVRKVEDSEDIIF